VRAAADLLTEIPNGIDLYTVAVPLFKQANRAGLAGLAHGHLFVTYREVPADLFIDNDFHRRDLFGRQLVRMREIEAEPFGRNVAATLLGVRPQYLPQRLVEQMGCRVEFCRDRRSLGETSAEAGSPSLPRFS